MIGTILYRESCQGILNYVFGKEGMRILGYGNMYSPEISQKFFGSVLHFQGQRNATKNRYAHITLNLPHGEHYALKREFPAVRERLYQLETREEKETLESNYRLIGKILENGIFDVGK